MAKPISPVKACLVDFMSPGSKSYTFIYTIFFGGDPFLALETGNSSFLASRIFHEEISRVFVLWLVHRGVKVNKSIVNCMTL